MKKEEFLEKLSILIRNGNFSEIDKIIKKFKDENNFEMISLSSQAFINLYEYEEAIKILDTIKDKISNGMLYIGESAGAIITSKNIEYNQIMDNKDIASDSLD